MAIPWIPILTAGSTLLSSLFGGESSKESQNQSSSTTGATAGTTKLESDQTTTQSQVQNSSQQSSQQSNENQSSTQTGGAQVSRLDSQTLNQLTEQVRNLMAGTGRGSTAVQNQLDAVSASGDDFDADAYVAGVMAAANDTITSGMESDIAKIEAGSGGSRRSNSNTALLANKLRTSAGAQLGGIKADASAKASELTRARQESKTGQITNLAAGADSTALNLLGALLQASESQTSQQQGSTVTAGTTSGTTTGSTTTQTNETTNQQQEQTQAQTQSSATKTVASGKKSSNDGLGGFFDSIADIIGAIF